MGVPAKDKEMPGVVTMREETRVPVPPVVVLNPGAADSRKTADRPKQTGSAAIVSRGAGTQELRRGAEDGDEVHGSRRPRLTAYRNYKDLRDYTLNR